MSEIKWVVKFYRLIASSSLANLELCLNGYQNCRIFDLYEKITSSSNTKSESDTSVFETPEAEFMYLSARCHLSSSRNGLCTLQNSRGVLVEVAGHVYPVDFVILDIKENKKRPFILGTPFLTTANAMIKFDKGTITLRSGKSKISFHRIPESLCKDEKGIKNDIEHIAPTMTVNKLVLEWEEKIKLHQEKEMEFDQWRSKNFKNEHPALVKIKDGMDDEGEVT
ncbi:reverse transcriptase domain-containing protein [Tanacetum coccineum]